MEISLKIELSDEQYNDLMDKSFDAIMGTKEVTDKLQEIIISNMQEKINDWVTDNATSWISTIYDVGRYSRSTEEEFVKKLIKDAGSEYTDHISKTIKKTMSDMIQKVDVGSIIYKILLDAVMRGVTGGIDAWQAAINANNNIIRENFGNIKEYLQYNIHTEPPIQDTLQTDIY